jgi:hypothetical protein
MIARLVSAEVGGTSALLTQKQNSHAKDTFFLGF